jgi:cytochrome d ubiquinol oxidase subunit I
VVYNFLRTSQAATNAGIVRPLFAVVVILYLTVAVATVLVLRTMSRRWTAGEPIEPPVPYGPLDMPSTTVSSPPLAAPSGSRRE